MFERGSDAAVNQRMPIDQGFTGHKLNNAIHAHQGRRNQENNNENLQLLAGFKRLNKIEIEIRSLQEFKEKSLNT